MPYTPYNKNLKHNLNEIVKKSILEIFILSLFIVILVFLIIKLSAQTLVFKNYYKNIGKHEVVILL